MPKRWALVSFLAGCCFTTTSQGLDLGPINLPVFRLLMLIGVLRVIAKGERIVGGINLIDKLLIGWAVWYFISSFSHDPNLDAGTTYVCGIIYNQLVFYFLVRIWCNNLDDMADLIKVVAVILVPIALEMCMEKLTGKNMFSVFGGVSENVTVREGKLRAQGPFLHPILAGTVGATCFPLFIGIYQKHRNLAILGMIAGVTMVFASASSGPVMSFMAAIFALVMWKFKHLTSLARKSVVAIYLLMMVVMERPPYYIISKIDISGGSTGWHRSRLIEQTLNHFSEWWLFGTDHTLHWMKDQGVAVSPTHTDITNYYIGFAIGSGFLGMMLIIAAFAVSFNWVGKILTTLEEKRPDNAFMIWCFGSALFSHAVTSVSVSYFDQSVVFLWLNVAVISSMYSALPDFEEEEAESQLEPEFSETEPAQRWRREWLDNLPRSGSNHPW